MALFILVCVYFSRQFPLQTLLHHHTTRSFQETQQQNKYSKNKNWITGKQENKKTEKTENEKNKWH